MNNNNFPFENNDQQYNEKEADFLNYYLNETSTQAEGYIENDESALENTPLEEVDQIEQNNNFKKLTIQDLIPFDTRYTKNKPKEAELPVAVANEAIKKEDVNSSSFILDEIFKLEEGIKRLKNLVLGGQKHSTTSINASHPAVNNFEPEVNMNEKIVMGIFDGEKMIGSDNKQYSIPANYASKSKLIDGDELKLTIKASGAFVYKQTKPAERIIVQGTLAKREEGGFVLVQGDKKWRLIKASVTYLNGVPGDRATAFIPKYKNSNWAALDNVIRNY
ncbi:hypothetical protein ISS03_03350 [Patescibacteria group bacterium]|nr:hypothetical protein [Patescibacteria group bacterium]